MERTLTKERVRLRRTPQRLAIGIIRFYQATFSRLTPRTCRFTPTCSQYAIEALENYGLWHGSMKALGRLLRCHPFHPGGFDPVH